MRVRSAAVCVLCAFSLGILFNSFLEAGNAALLTAPKKLFAGSSSSATVTTFDGTTRLPSSAQVSLSLVSQDRKRSYPLVSSGTGVNGQANLSFMVPASLSGSFFLVAQVEGLPAALEMQTTVARGAAILLETDKPIYKPGQKIQGRVVLLNSNLQPSAGSVRVVIQDAKGLRIAKWDLTTDQYGVAPFSLDLASELNLGVWRIVAESGSTQIQKDLRVERYVLPRFDVAVELPKSWAVVDEAITGNIDAHYFFGKPVVGNVEIVAKRWIGAWDAYATVKGPLTSGRMPFTLRSADFVTGSPYNGGQGSVLLEVSVTDSAGNVQSTNQTVTITQAPVLIGLSSEVRTVKPGFESKVLVTTEAPDGKPVEARVSVQAAYYGVGGSVLASFKQDIQTSEGLGQLTIRPPSGTGVVQITASTTASGHVTETVLEIGSDYSPSGDFITLLRTNGRGQLKVGEWMQCSVAGSGGPISSGRSVYYEVYAGGRTVFSNVVDGGNFMFIVSPDMVPQAKVIAYVITDRNEVAADSLAFDVGLNLTASVSAGFSSPQVKPGDPVRVTIDAGTGRKTLLGISVVDQSVLALGQSRLHMADVFAELERVFMAPAAEVHEDPQGWFRPTISKGTIDVIHDAGLEVVASPGVSVPTGVSLWRNFFPPAVPVSPPQIGGDSEKAAAPESPRVRQFFPETWVWQPTTFTDDAGRLTLDLNAPDTITGWKMAVVGTSPSATGQGLVLGEAELTVFQDFFVEPTLPYSLTRGETFTLKVDLFNYLNEPQRIELRLSQNEAFTTTGETTLSVDVPANSVSSKSFQLKAGRIGTFPMQLTALGPRMSDAVLREVMVVPEGWPAESVKNGVVRAGEQVQIEIPTPEFAVPDSQEAYLYLTPSPVAQTMNGLADLLHMPYGCGEQNMIFLAPDVEILRYLRETGDINPEIRAKAEYFVNVGYQRELTYQTVDGGFAAFGGNDGSLWLTAFVLSTFAAARDVRDIDETVLKKAADMIKGRQRQDGAFTTDNFLIHTEMDGGLANEFGMCAYAATAIAELEDSSYTSTLQKAAGFLQSTYPAVYDDPYSLAIGAVALQRIQGFGSVAEAIVDRLIQLGVRDEYGLHWKPYPVETTGYAAIALLNSMGGAGRPEAQLALDWLSTQRNALGGYGNSTQDTVVAIRALFLAADKVHRDINIGVTVLDGSSLLFSADLNRSNFDLLHQFKLPVKPWVVLRAPGTGL